MGLLVLGPAFVGFRAAGFDPMAAGIQAWYVGMAATVTMGALKLLMSFVGRGIRRLIPQAGLLGSLAGIALMLIGFFPLVELFEAPIVGFLTLGLVLYALVAKGAVPAAPTLRLALPHFDAGILTGFAQMVNYLPLIVPFALLTVIGGVNNAESARVAGDDYDVRSILLVEGAATLLAGLAGGVAQTTPYIGHPAYKQMGARAGYTWLTGIFIGVGGMLGFLANLIELIPLAVLAPVLVFLSLNITVQAFSAVPVRLAPAVAISFFPSIARLTIELSDPSLIAPERITQLMAVSGHGLPVLAGALLLLSFRRAS